MEYLNKDVKDYCWENLSREESFCADMCESVIVYNGGFNDKYLDSYKETLGEKRVKEIYDTIAKFIYDNCEIIEDNSRDSEGLSYSAIVWKNRVSYENLETGEITYKHREAVKWFNEGVNIRVYNHNKYSTSWIH